jgi:WD40 repeat protein
VINADNANLLTQIGRYGNGIFEQANAWSPDGKTLAVAGSIGIWLYNTEDWNASPQLIDLDKGVENIAYSPDGSTLAYSTEDNITHLVDAVTHSEDLSFIDGDVFAFSPDGKYKSAQVFDGTR